MSFELNRENLVQSHVSLMDFCTNAHSRHSLHGLHAQRMDVDEHPDNN